MKFHVVRSRLHSIIHSALIYKNSTSTQFMRIWIRRYINKKIVVNQTDRSIENQYYLL